MQSRRQLLVLLVLLVVLAAVVAYEWRIGVGPGPAGVSGSPRVPRAGGSSRSQGTASGAVPSVRLDALVAARNEPAPPRAERNLFRFETREPAATSGGGKPVPGLPGGGTATTVPVEPALPPPPPPIPLKFIGVVQASNQQKLAVLSDTNTRDVFYGREGDVIDGRYRILRIGVESIDMAYVDGRGRQSIRLTGL